MYALASMSILCIIFVANTSEFCFVRYLALVAALASEADWVLVPEWPPERGWEDVLCNKLAQVCFISDSVLNLAGSDWCAALTLCDYFVYVVL